MTLIRHKIFGKSEIFLKSNVLKLKNYVLTMSSVNLLIEYAIVVKLSDFSLHEGFINFFFYWWTFEF